MDELAAEAGITKPILYSHFGDKAGLAAALTVRVAAELDKALVASLSKVQSPEQVVSSTIDSFCEFVETETELYHFLWYAAMNNPDGAGGGKLLIAGFADQIAFTLGSALRQVGEDSGAAEPWAYAIVGMTLTAGEWWLERRTMTRDDLVAYLTRLLWGGLRGAGFDRLPSGFSASEGTSGPEGTVTPIARPAAADS
jgi:AcrR family transcriptional regulator